MGADTIPDDFNSAFNSSTHSVEKHSAGNITGFERRSSDGKSVGGGPKGFGLAGGGCDGIDIHGHTSVHPNSHIHSTRLPGGQSSSSSPRRHSGFEFRDRDGDSEKRSSNTGGGIIRSSSPLPEFGSRDNSGKENPEFGSSISPNPSLSPVRKTSALRPQRPVDIVKDKENNKERRKGSGLEHTRDVDNGSDICEELNERSDVGNDGDDNSDDSGDDEMLESGRNCSGKDKEGEGEIKTIPFLWPTPLRILFGHTQDVIDISWSKSHFILSASADHNVRLWHVTRGDCLQVFRHPDIATSIDFHPLHDRYFISGCFDRRLRVWDIISDARTKEWVSLSETVRNQRIMSYCVMPCPAMTCGVTYHDMMLK